MGPFALPRADIKLILQVSRCWSTSWEMSGSPGNCADQQQIKGTAGNDKATVHGEQEYGDALLRPLLGWKQIGEEPI